MGVLAVASACCNLTMRSSGPRGQAVVFPDILSARGRLTRRWMAVFRSVDRRVL